MNVPSEYESVMAMGGPLQSGVICLEAEDDTVHDLEVPVAFRTATGEAFWDAFREEMELSFDTPILLTVNEVDVSDKDIWSDEPMAVSGSLRDTRNGVWYRLSGILV